MSGLVWNSVLDEVHGLGHNRCVGGGHRGFADIRTYTSNEDYAAGLT